jgi:erythrin-vacuolar iron transport family protein
MFVLQYVHAGPAVLMDGSVSTLSFAAAFATHNNWDTFLVGLAASVGAGISMAFAEALSDDGSLTGRGAPRITGMVCGPMTTLGGLGLTCLTLCRTGGQTHFGLRPAFPGSFVFCELWAIAWVRARSGTRPSFGRRFRSLLVACWC